MSTKNTIAIANETLRIGEEEYQQTIHCFTECFDDESFEIEIWRQGAFTNDTVTLSLPRPDAIRFASALGAWAAKAREVADE